MKVMASRVYTLKNRDEFVRWNSNRDESMWNKTAVNVIKEYENETILWQKLKANRTIVLTVIY